jgi:hypothetical protein
LKARRDTEFGSSSYDKTKDSYTLTGTGADIWETADDFHFAWKKLQGDGSITARIDSIEDVHEWTKAGVMVRSTLEPDCQNAMMLLTPSGRLSLQYRHTELGSTSALRTPRGTIQLPHWVRLTRTGSHFTAEHGDDGSTWHAVLDTSDRPARIEIPMDETVCIGLAVASHDITKAAAARLSNVATRGNVTPPGPFTESQDIPSQFPSAPRTQGNND